MEIVRDATSADYRGPTIVSRTDDRLGIFARLEGRYPIVNTLAASRRPLVWCLLGCNLYGPWHLDGPYVVVGPPLGIPSSVALESIIVSL